MDTIIWLISNHQVYVGDYYKNNIKKVTFEKADSWEVYGIDDLEKLIDYMNYPLHYNHFRKSQLIILFDEAKTYEMLSKVKDSFKESAGILIRRIEPFLLKIAEQEALKPAQKISFSDKVYELTQKEEGQLILEAYLEEVQEEEQVIQIDPVTLYAYLIEMQKEDGYKKKIQSVEEVFKNELILSPTTLFTKDGQKEKCYLQVEDVLMSETLVKDQSKVLKGDVLFKYKHSVQKLFGRIKIEEVAKCASREGQICFIKPLDKSRDIWAYKDEVLGVLGMLKDTKENLLRWYDEIIRDK